MGANSVFVDGVQYPGLVGASHVRVWKGSDTKKSIILPVRVLDEERDLMDIAEYVRRHGGALPRYQEFRRENQQHVAIATPLLKPLDAKHGDVMRMEEFVTAPDMNALKIELCVKLHSRAKLSRWNLDIARYGGYSVSELNHGNFCDVVRDQLVNQVVK